jgi:cell division protease FtsH
MCSALGGRAAEELIFGKISTGALSDLEKVTKQAYAMVSIYGLNKRVGNISFYDSQGRDMFTKPYSDETARVIDEEVSILIESQYQRALQILTENKDKLTELASKLLTNEVIFKEDLELIFGKREWDTAEINHPSEPAEFNDQLDTNSTKTVNDETNETLEEGIKPESSKEISLDNDEEKNDSSEVGSA